MADKGRKYHRPKEGQKHRVEIRRNKQVRTRRQNLTHDLQNDTERAEDAESSERVAARAICPGGARWSESQWMATNWFELSMKPGAARGESSALSDSMSWCETTKMVESTPVRFVACFVRWLETPEMS